MGADSLCIKDMAGLLVPYEATRLVEALKEATSLPIDLHTHYTSGVASMKYMRAVEAGVDMVDTAISPFALGTPITCRLADTLEPELEKLEKEMAQWKEQDEDVLSYALFPQVATDFFKYRAAQKNKIDLGKADMENGAYPV